MAVVSDMSLPYLDVATCPAFCKRHGGDRLLLSQTLSLVSGSVRQARYIGPPADAFSLDAFIGSYWLISAPTILGD